MRIQPLNDQILIKREKPPETSAGGIIIPATAQEPERFARVVACGPGRYTEQGHLIRPTVQKGDLVLVRQWNGGTPVKVDGEDMLMLREDELLGIVVEEHTKAQQKLPLNEYPPGPGEKENGVDAAKRYSDTTVA